MDMIKVPAWLSFVRIDKIVHEKFLLKKDLYLVDIF